MTLWDGLVGWWDFKEGDKAPTHYSAADLERLRKTLEGPPVKAKSKRKVTRRARS